MRAVGAVLLALILGAPATQDPTIDIAGAWILNRDLSSAPQPDDDMGRQPRGRPGGGGGVGGRGGFGGSMGRPGGMGEGMGRPSEEDQRKAAVMRRRLSEIPERLIIVREAQAVSITDGTGRRMNYKTDGKRQEQFTGDGEFTTKSRLEGLRLIVEEDFGGRRITTSYTPTVEGNTLRLEVTVKPEGGRGFEGARGGPGGSSTERAGNPPRELKRVYDLEARGQPGYFFF